MDRCSPVDAVEDSSGSVLVCRRVTLLFFARGDIKGENITDTLAGYVQYQLIWQNTLTTVIARLAKKNKKNCKVDGSNRLAAIQTA